MIRIAVAQYAVYRPQNWDDYVSHLTDWIEKAVEQHAELVVFPEYASLILTALVNEKKLIEQYQAIQSLLDRFLELHRHLAQKYQLCIISATFPVQEHGKFLNRSFVFFPNGEIHFQDKLQMTRFEQGVISSGETIRLFQFKNICFGIAICYDSEFPLLIRKYVENGADLIVVPSCTETWFGFHRVHLSCRARALENQCYVAQSCILGSADWVETIDQNVGRAGIFSPVDRYFPNDGILALGNLEQSQWVIADMDISLIKKVRRNGEVFNYRDWDKQHPFNKIEKIIL
jgi:predicted amidohydrolase